MVALDVLRNEPTLKQETSDTLFPSQTCTAKGLASGLEPTPGTPQHVHRH